MDGGGEYVTRDVAAFVLFRRHGRGAERRRCRYGNRNA